MPTATKNLNLRVDANLKEEADSIFSELGVSTSTAITMFLKSVVRYGGIPFSLRLPKGERDTLQAVDDVNHPHCRNTAPRKVSGSCSEGKLQRVPGMPYPS